MTQKSQDAKELRQPPISKLIEEEEERFRKAQEYEDFTVPMVTALLDELKKKLKKVENAKYGAEIYAAYHQKIMQALQ